MKIRNNRLVLNKHDLKVILRHIGLCAECVSYVNGNDLKNLKMTRGDSANIAITGLDLVQGDVIKLTVKEHSNTPEKKMQIILTEFDAQGNGVIRITPDDTKGLDFRTYVYDIELTRADGRVSTVVKKHEFKIEEEVSWQEAVCKQTISKTQQSQQR